MEYISLVLEPLFLTPIACGPSAILENMIISLGDLEVELLKLSRVSGEQALFRCLVEEK